jgi:hypothetical protein
MTVGLISFPGGGFGISPRMSTIHRILVTFGLSVVFSAGWAGARSQALPDDPSPPRSSAADPATQEPREQYLLLTSGQLIRGIITESGPEVLIEQKVGVMHFPKKCVEGSFDSIHDAYLHRLEQLPDRDSDERMKLALWCLNLKLTKEARELLSTVVQHNPNHPQAKAMLVSIDQAASRLAQRERDPAVRQTKAVEMAEEKPEAFDATILRKAQRGLGIRDLPVIFDLPLPLAIRRTEEFTRYVHPLLQAYCARCHDGEYPGEFQLVPIKSRTERTPDALRANLDATLRLIDPKNPSHSVLLSSTLRPHGGGAKPRPIFPGSNDQAYKVLAEWASHLTAPKPGDESTRVEPSQRRAETDEVFAADRNRSSSSRLEQGMSSPSKIPAPRPFPAPRAGGAAAGQEPDEFPIPFAISGVRPNLGPPRKVADKPAKQPSTAASPKAPAKSGAAGATGPARQTNPSDDPDDDDLPDPAQEKGETAAAKKSAKPLSIDPSLLEKALQYRNANRQKPD